MRERIRRSMLLLTTVTFLVTALLLAVVFAGALNSQMRREVRQEAMFLVGAVELSAQPEQHLAALTGVQGDTRVTLIAADGSIRYDSAADAATMENHLDRPEVRAALTSGIGQGERQSETLGQRTYYCAVRLQSGDLLRLARTTDSILTALTGAVTLLLLIAGGVSVLSFVLADRMTRRIVEPINSFDLDQPVEGELYDELSPLLLRIGRQKAKIAEQKAQLATRQQEFAAITASMAEGLVLLDPDGRILTVNQSALTLLGSPVAQAEGRSYLTLHRGDTLREAVQAALSGRQQSLLLEQEGRTLQLYASPVVEQDGARPRGALLLILDVTERRRAEQLRREFSANVSHELKTPLTSISGFAELIRDGMAKPQDVPAFAGRIHAEAARLLALVEDIIRISRLDERNIGEEAAPLELRALADSVVERLAPRAAAAEVSLAVEGEPLLLTAVAPLLDELLVNLCDNAIKYNRPGGTVTVTLAQEESAAVIAVADTGIGIAPEHQGRIFERFYRVDKSRSQQVEGTGLGLSIVKHIVEFHGGTLALESRPGSGTAIRVTLPCA